MKELRELAEEAIQYHKTQHERNYGVADFPEKHYEKIGVVVEAGQVLSLLEEVQKLHEQVEMLEYRCNAFEKGMQTALEKLASSRKSCGALVRQVAALKAGVKKFYSYRMEILGSWERSQDTIKGLFEDLSLTEIERDGWKARAEKAELADHPYREACPKCWARFQSAVKHSRKLEAALENAVKVMKATKRYKHFLCLSGAIDIGERALGRTVVIYDEPPTS